MSVSTPLTTGGSRPMASSALGRSLSSSERRATSPLSAVHSTSARPASLKARMVISVRRTAGCTMIGSAALSGDFGAGNRGPWQALFRLNCRFLIGDFGWCQPLHADGEPRLVHHREHGGQPAVFLAGQPAGGRIVILSGGGGGV